MIAATMVYYLHRRHSQFTRTQGVIGWLMLYFVSTSVVLVALVGTVLICFLVAPDNMLWAGVIALYARSVSNCFFGALNARQVLRGKKGQTVTFGGVSIQNSHSPTSVELHQVQVRVGNDTTITMGSNTTLENGHCDIKIERS
ncbi:hypothetical protein QCA50_013027 [Cerrena zonata]|uniref:DUF6534 domain-containing protein n=1 Tax=Cerrena zonata TaxID=2478898 RepID=A0AAW0FS31_9APHY